MISMSVTSNLASSISPLFTLSPLFVRAPPVLLSLPLFLLSPVNIFCPVFWRPPRHSCSPSSLHFVSAPDRKAYPSVKKAVAALRTELGAKLQWRLDTFISQIKTAEVSGGYSRENDDSISLKSWCVAGCLSHRLMAFRGCTWNGFFFCFNELAC